MKSQSAEENLKPTKKKPSRLQKLLIAAPRQAKRHQRARVAKQEQKHPLHQVVPLAPNIQDLNAPNVQNIRNDTKLKEPSDLHLPNNVSLNAVPMNNQPLQAA